MNVNDFEQEWLTAEREWLTAEQKIWRVMASTFASDIARLDAQVVTLMKAHATTKAAGPAYAALHLERMASEIIGPGWRKWAVYRERVSA